MKIILKNFSSKPQKDWDEEDDDHLEDVHYDFENRRKGSAVITPLVSGVLGSSIGHSIGKGKGAIIGGIAGLAGGIGLHKGIIKPSLRAEEDHYRNRYMRIKDKEGRRRKTDHYENDKSRREAAREGGREAALWGSILRSR